MARRLVAGIVLLSSLGAGAASASPLGTATATVVTGKSSLTLSGGTCRPFGRGFQVRMIPGERQTFQLSFYTRKIGSHRSRPGERVTGGRIAFSRGRGVVYSVTFTVRLAAAGRKGTFSGRLASDFGHTPFRGSFTC